MMEEAELLDLKKQITEAGTKAAELKGQRTLLTKQLKEKWNITTPKQGKTKIESLQTSIDKMDEEIKTRTEELEEQLNEQNTGSEE
jgi:hypothetical protein